MALMLQSSPPYLQFMEEGEQLGRASFLAGVCKGIGIVEINSSEADEIIHDFRRRAVIARVDGPIIDQSVAGGVDREKRAIELLMDLGDDDGSARRLRREEQLIDYLGNGCAELTLDYPQAFKLSD